MVDGTPIDPDLLLEKLLERQAQTKALREKALDAVSTGRYEKAQALALLYVGDVLQDFAMTSMLPSVSFEEKKPDA